MTDLSKLSDPRWRINNLYKIVNKDGKLIPFKENPFQNQVNVSNDPALILKCRQLGISTGCVLKKLDKTIFNEHQNTVILSHEKDSLEKIFRIVQRAINYMDPQIKPIIAKGGGSKTQFYFPEVNSRISVDLESRSDTIQNLHISEIAFMKDMEKVKATIDAVPIGGDVTIESTANGLNHFNDLWFQQDSPYKKFFFPWFLTTEYQLPTKPLELTDDEKELVSRTAKYFNHVLTHEQIAFRRWKIAQKGGGIQGLRHFMQEYPEDELTCFLTTGDAVFNLMTINSLMKDAQAPIRDSGYLKIYQPMDKSKTYVVGADTSEGVGGDYSVGVMIEVQTRRIVAVLRGHFKPSDFAGHLVDLCKAYTTPHKPCPLLGVEKNNHGHAVLLELNEHLHYPNLYYRKNASGEQDKTPGWVTDKVTRPIMLNTFINAVENKSIYIPDLNILAECLTLVNNDGKIEASTGKHDDAVIAASIAVQMLTEASNLVVYDNLESKILL
jgi:hypothetical protein